MQVLDGGVTFTLPIRTYSEANCSENWRKKHARHKTQKAMVSYAMMRSKEYVSLPCTVTMKRYCKTFLDYQDNLPISFKYILDTICAHITGDFRPGRADGRPGFTFAYEQEKSKNYFIRITIQSACKEL
jgi:hypothetical protein